MKQISMIVCLKPSVIYGWKDTLGKKIKKCQNLLINLLEERIMVTL